MFAITCNHHDGFSMYDTRRRIRSRVDWTAPGGPKLQNCDLAYSVVETPFKRDVVRELCDAGRKCGLKIDLYFSHPNWYDAGFRPYCNHPLSVGAVWYSGSYARGTSADDGLSSSATYGIADELRQDRYGLSRHVAGERGVAPIARDDVGTPQASAGCNVPSTRHR